MPMLVRAAGLRAEVGVDAVSLRPRLHARRRIPPRRFSEALRNRARPGRSVRPPGDRVSSAVDCLADLQRAFSELGSLACCSGTDFLAAWLALPPFSDSCCRSS